MGGGVRGVAERESLSSRHIEQTLSFLLRFFFFFSISSRGVALQKAVWTDRVRRRLHPDCPAAMGFLLVPRRKLKKIASNHLAQAGVLDCVPELSVLSVYQTARNLPADGAVVLSLVEEYLRK